MKNTMSKRNIAKFHKLLLAEVPPPKISKLLGVETKTLKRFTPDAIAKAKAKQAEAAAAKLPTAKPAAAPAKPAKPTAAPAS